MLLGPFDEANQVQQGQPVEIAASDAAVFALLEYIYGEQLQVELEDSFDLLHLADAYNLPELAATIEAGLRASLDSAPVTTALKVLQLAQDLHDLKAACEQKVAENFEMCIDLVEFLELSSVQLSRILRREDLKVSREEVVVKGLFQWFRKSRDGGVYLGLLLQNVDFQSLSSDNLARLQHLSASMGPIGRDLQREVGDALRVHRQHRAERTPDAFRPKRRCLQNWSPELGASSLAPEKVLPYANSMCCRDGAIYYTTMDGQGSSVLRWKPGDTRSQVVAGRGARVNGVNDLGVNCEVSVSPEGNIFVLDEDNQRLLRFDNDSRTVLSEVELWAVSCSPNGEVFVVTQFGEAVERLVGATLHPVISSNNLPAELQFEAFKLFVTKDEVIYLSDRANSRILRLNPGEAEPVVVGEAPNKEGSRLLGLFVTEEEKIYVADAGQRKVWAFHPGDATWTEVLMCPGALDPVDVLVQGRSLYVSMVADSSPDDFDPEVSGVYEYSLPPKLQLG